jgi:hypothetical protein
VAPAPLREAERSAPPVVAVPAVVAVLPAVVEELPALGRSLLRHGQDCDQTAALAFESHVHFPHFHFFLLLSYFLIVSNPQGTRLGEVQC